MNEKKGNTLKLKYDFDISAELEIFLPPGNDWYRVTARAFRSFDGKRRLNKQEHKGLIYIYGTNKIMDLQRYPRHIIVGIEDVESKKRQHESF